MERLCGRASWREMNRLSSRSLKKSGSFHCPVKGIGRRWFTEAWEGELERSEGMDDKSGCKIRCVNPIARFRFVFCFSKINQRIQFYGRSG